MSFIKKAHLRNIFGCIIACVSRRLRIEIIYPRMFRCWVLLIFFPMTLGAIDLDVVESQLRDLSSDQMEGRMTFTRGGKKARDWIKDILKKNEVSVLEQPFRGGVNLFGQWSTSPPEIIIGAHYDHHGRNCKPIEKARSSICNGAADNAGGVVALTAALSELRQSKIPLLLAFWDAEEHGLVGSKHFVRNPPVDLSRVRLYINLDIIGLDLFPGLKRSSFVLGSETGGKELQEDLRATLSQPGFDFHYLSYAMGQGRSDMTSFVGRPIPFIFFTDADGGFYHTTGDEVQNSNPMKIKIISEALIRFLLFNGRKSYTYEPPQGAAGVYLPLFSDALALEPLFRKLLLEAPLNGIAGASADSLKERLITLQTQIHRGPQKFGLREKVQLAKSAREILDLSREISQRPSSNSAAAE